MIAGTAQVRLSLGSDSSKITTQQVEDALWHYYYDVEKSVAYLVNKYISPKPAKPQAQKKNKSEGRSSSFHTDTFGTGLDKRHLGAFKSARCRLYDLGGFKSELEINRTSVTHHLTFRGADDKHFKRSPAPSLLEFFHDMPWLNIPNDRCTIFIEPSRKCGGLLGGSSSSGKMSKLQALAAARKKKAEEQKLENRKMPSETKKVASETAKEHASSMSGALVEKSSSRQDLKSLPIQPTAQIYLSRDRTTHDLNPLTVQTQVSNSSAAIGSPIEQLELAAPSAFARTLLGSSISSSAPVPRNNYPIPYMSLTSSVADAFSEPSPDDVVLTAQSKGSLLAKRVQA